MKKIITFGLSACIILLYLSCTGCAAPSGMSPVETVRYYYEQNSNRDNAKMNSVVYSKMRRYVDFDGFISVKLLTCDECKNTEYIKQRFEPEWYDKTPYDIALVQTSFDIQYEDWANTSYSNGENYCDYYLVKNSADSDWIIVQWGLG